MMLRKEHMQSLESSRTRFKSRLWDLLAVEPQASYLISLSLCLFMLKNKKKPTIFSSLAGLSERICLARCKGSRNLNSFSYYPTFMQLAES